MEIPFATSTVSEVAAAEINADATISVGTSGGASVFAGVVLCSKGRPFEPIFVTKNTYRSVLGREMHPSMGSCAEPMRHVAEAVAGGDGYVVRVLGKDALFPVITVKPAAQQQKLKQSKVVAAEGDAGTKAVPLAAEEPLPIEVTCAGAPYGADPVLAEGELLKFFIYDGDPSTNRSIEMITADADTYGDNRFTLQLTETDELGFDTALESHIVSLDPLAKDDMGQSAFIETILETASKCMRAVCNSDVASTSIIKALQKTAFTGGTNGDMNKIDPAAYDKAVDVLKHTMLGYNGMCGLGCYDTTVLALLGDVCNSRRISGYFDVPTTLNYGAAIEFMADMNIDNFRMSWYHFPFLAKDPTTGARISWGLSGTAFRAKAMGVAKVSDVGGWHYSPAGEERGVIDRRGIVARANLDNPDYVAMVKARINKVAVGTGGSMLIDDSLTSCKRENYLRFSHVVSTMDAITREFYALARSLKHQPDGLTLEGMTKGMTSLLERFVTSGALRAPRNAEDGTEPYVLNIIQKDIDLWEVDWAVCVTGTARRFFGRPALIR
ncbi:MAG TPA: hypothetical protein VGL07_17030 [Buttiauxella sp.]|jgi:hypothetical protein